MGVFRASTPFNIFKNKRKVEAMLNESLNRFIFDSIHFQRAFNTFFALSTMLNDPFKRPRDLVQTSFRRMLKQMLILFKRALIKEQLSLYLEETVV